VKSKKLELAIRNIRSLEERLSTLFHCLVSIRAELENNVDTLNRRVDALARRLRDIENPRLTKIGSGKIDTAHADHQAQWVNETISDFLRLLSLPDPTPSVMTMLTSFMKSAYAKAITGS